MVLRPTATVTERAIHTLALFHNEASKVSMSVSLVLMLAVSFLWPVQAQAQPDAPREYKIKAAFIYHFLEFTEWPEATQEQDRLNVCVLGPSPFRGALNSIDGNRVAGKRVTVRHLQDTEGAHSCHTVFLGSEAPASQLLAALPRKGVLTVGEDGAFMRHGGMIRFFETKNNIRFEVNLAAVQQADLKISSKMLKLARIR